MSLEGLLPFHRTILEEIHDPSNSQLVLLARGLGLRKIVCTLMQIYDQSTNLVLLVNASSDEEAAIGEELGIMGCRKPGLRTVSYEMGKQDRWVSLFMSHVKHQFAPILTLFVLALYTNSSLHPRLDLPNNLCIYYNIIVLLTVGQARTCIKMAA
jgi:hypothetical protein